VQPVDGGDPLLNELLAAVGQQLEDGPGLVWFHDLEVRPAEASDGHRVGVGMTRQPARSASVLSSQSSVISSVLRPLLPPKARTRAESRAGTFSTRSPSAAVRCASPSPTPRAPSTAQVRSRHGWTNWFELLVAVAFVGEPLLGQDVLLGVQEERGVAGLVGSTPITTAVVPASLSWLVVEGGEESSTTLGDAGPS
jgi:hypothetical protein